MFFILLKSHREIEQAARESLAFLSATLIPALFPFAVLSRFLLTASLLPCRGKLSGRIAKRLRLSAPLLPAYSLGLFCGFPIGAYAAASLCEAGFCRESDAHRSASLANNASAAFLFGAAAALFQSQTAGVILFVSQSAATLLVSVCYQSDPVPKDTPVLTPKPSYLSLAADAINRAGLAMLSLSAFSVFFSVIAKALLLAGLPAWLALLLEPTAALGYAASLVPAIGLSLSLSLAALSLGFSGFSVIMQAQALFKGKLPLKQQLLCRTAIGVLSFLLTFLLSICFGS